MRAGRRGALRHGRYRTRSLPSFQPLKDRYVLTLSPKSVKTLLVTALDHYASSGQVGSKDTSARLQATNLDAG